MTRPAPVEFPAFGLADLRRFVPALRAALHALDMRRRLLERRCEQTGAEESGRAAAELLELVQLIDPSGPEEES